MATSGWTKAYNDALRDNRLSLAAKGLYVTICSYIGLPGWRLSKSRLFASSKYSLNKAWAELKQLGYLHHYFYKADNGSFAHIYDLQQKATDTSIDCAYCAPTTRPSGDCRLVLSGDKSRDYTQLSTELLRQKDIPLAIKGLYALTAHLQRIPNFVLSPKGICTFCVEKSKHFATLWRKLKLCGLLKQKRLPTGQHNAFVYTYQLEDAPNLQTPYLVNCRADGTLSSYSTIAQAIEKSKTRIRQVAKRLVSAVHRAPKKSKAKANIPASKPSEQHNTQVATEIKERIEYERLSLSYSRDTLDQVVQALVSLKTASSCKINGRVITEAECGKALSALSADCIAQFMRSNSLQCAQNAHHPILYLRTALYNYLDKYRNLPASAPTQIEFDTACSSYSPNLAAWEEEWLERVKSYTKNSQPTD